MAAAALAQLHCMDSEKVVVVGRLSIGRTGAAVALVVGVGAAAWLGASALPGFKSAKAAAPAVAAAPVVAPAAAVATGASVPPAAVKPAQAAFAGVSPRLHEAAALLGHGAASRFWRIDWPLARRGLQGRTVRMARTA